METRLDNAIPLLERTPAALRVQCQLTVTEVELGPPPRMIAPFVLSQAV